MVVAPPFVGGSDFFTQAEPFSDGLVSCRCALGWPRRPRRAGRCRPLAAAASRSRHPLLGVGHAGQLRADGRRRVLAPGDNARDAVVHDRRASSGPTVTPAHRAGRRRLDDRVFGRAARPRPRVERRLSGSARWTPPRDARLRRVSHRVHVLARRGLVVLIPSSRGRSTTSPRSRLRRSLTTRKLHFLPVRIHGRLGQDAVQMDWRVGVAADGVVVTDGDVDGAGGLLVQ